MLILEPGDVIHLQFLGRSVVVLNSVQAAVDLLEKRSANYSDRPKFIIYETYTTTTRALQFSTIANYVPIQNGLER